MACVSPCIDSNMAFLMGKDDYLWRIYMKIYRTDTRNERVVAITAGPNGLMFMATDTHVYWLCDDVWELMRIEDVDVIGFNPNDI